MGDAAVVLVAVAAAPPSVVDVAPLLRFSLQLVLVGGYAVAAFFAVVVATAAFPPSRSAPAPPPQIHFQRLLPGAGVAVVNRVIAAADAAPAASAPGIAPGPPPPPAPVPDDCR